MIRHILLFSLDADVSESERRQMLDDLARFPEQFEQIRGWEMGDNRSDRDETFEYGVTMTFASRGTLDAYLKSEAHEAFVRDRFRPVVSNRAIVSFEV